MGRDRRPAPAILCPDRGVEAGDRQAAPVGVVHRQMRRPLLVLLGFDRLGHERAPSVGADHHARPLAHLHAAAEVTADAGDRSLGAQQLVDGEPLAQLRTRLHRCLDQQLVQHRAPRAVATRDAVDRLRRAGDRQRPEVERVSLDRRTARLLQMIQQPPARERRDPRRMHEVRGHRVAREGRLVEQQDPIALACQQHRRGEPAQRAPITIASYVPVSIARTSGSVAERRSHDRGAVARPRTGLSETDEGEQLVPSFATAFAHGPGDGSSGRGGAHPRRLSSRPARAR